MPDHPGGVLRRLRDSPSTIDVLLGLAVTIVLVVIIALAPVGDGVGDAPGGATVGGAGDASAALAYLFALGFGAVLLLRRQLPIGVLVLSVLGTFAYYSLQLPTIGVALPVVAAIGSAAERGCTRAAGIAGAVVVAVALAFRVRDDPQPLGYLLGTDTAMNLALVAAALALGHAIRSRRERDRQQRVIDELTAERADRESEQRLRSERERISRELHDTLGHALSVIALHAGVGREALPEEPDDASVAEAAKALEGIREQSASSLQELRAMVRMLRRDDAARERHVRSLEDLPALVGRMRDAGLVVDLRMGAGLDGEPLPPAVEAGAYRIVQESLTNVLRHADATRVQLRIDRESAQEGERLRILVRDDGRAPRMPGRAAAADAGERDADGGGTGLAGMAERARLLGGALDARDHPDGGFVVDALIPIPPPRRNP